METEEKIKYVNMVASMAVDCLSHGITFETFKENLKFVLLKLDEEGNAGLGSSKKIRASAVPHGGIFKIDDGTVCIRLMRQSKALLQGGPMLCADMGNGQIREVDALEWVELMHRNFYAA